MEVEKINTNNGWGFGGWIGKRTDLGNGLFHELGKDCYRHTGTTKHNVYRFTETDNFYDAREVLGALKKSIYKVQANENENYGWYVFADSEENAAKFTKQDTNFTYTITKLLDL